MELGITQYLDAFVDQGFDTWDTILDITESDLSVLSEAHPADPIRVICLTRISSRRTGMHLGSSSVTEE